MYVGLTKVSLGRKIIIKPKVEKALGTSKSGESLCLINLKKCSKMLEILLQHFVSR